MDGDYFGPREARSYARLPIVYPFLFHKSFAENHAALHRLAFSVIYACDPFPEFCFFIPPILSKSLRGMEYSDE